MVKVLCLVSSLLAQLRIGIIPLPTGCYFRKPLSESLCLFYIQNKIEDELHFCVSFLCTWING